MQKFNNYEQLLAIIEQIHDLPADDDRVIYDPLVEQTLEIQFNAEPGRKIVDDSGNERDVYDRLLLRNVQSFEVQRPDNDRPHRIVDLERIDAETYRFILTKARWLVKVTGDLSGEFGEAVDDTDFEFSFPNIALLVTGGMIIIGIIGLVLWRF